MIRHSRIPFFTGALCCVLQFGAFDTNAQTSTTSTVSTGMTIHIPETKRASVLDDGRVVYNMVEQMPTFPQDVGSFLLNNVKYPDEARNRNIQGRSVVRFIVNSDGETSDVEVLHTSGSKVLDKEAMRVVSTMKGWRPGVENGNRVAVYYQLPVTFKLEKK